MTDSHILVGDCVEIVGRLPENLVDAVVTDPPYHLQSISKRFANSPRTEKTERYAAGPYGRHAAGFMGKTWDGGDVSMNPATWAAFLRVMKPGAHLLAFGGTRTHHRIWTAIEDAGFEVRDTIMWVYGQGFPKSHDAGDGWGTALKPAWEPIVLARKPLSEKSVAANVLKWGTGAINIDACRIAAAEGDEPLKWETPRGGIWKTDSQAQAQAQAQALGRWPANVIHDGSAEVLEAFPDARGQIARSSSSETRKNQNAYGEMRRGGPEEVIRPRDVGGSAARFFYCAKASRKDRNESVEGPEKPLFWSSGTQSPGTFQSSGTKKAAKNNHPTVKPTALMRWLCRLVAPANGLILDPFCGSGSTGKAALQEGFRFVGIEKEAPYAEIAQQRVGASTKLHYPAMNEVAE